MTQCKKSSHSALLPIFVNFIRILLRLGVQFGNFFVVPCRLHATAMEFLEAILAHRARQPFACLAYQLKSCVLFTYVAWIFCALSSQSRLEGIIERSFSVPAGIGNSSSCSAVGRAWDFGCHSRAMSASRSLSCVLNNAPNAAQSVAASSARYTSRCAVFCV